jgi:hypothetical protein
VSKSNACEVYLSLGSLVGRISCGEKIGDVYNQDLRCVEREAAGLRSMLHASPPSRYVSDKEGVSRSRDVQVCCKVRDDRERKMRRCRGGSAWTILCH